MKKWCIGMLIIIAFAQSSSGMKHRARKQMNGHKNGYHVPSDNDGQICNCDLKIVGGTLAVVYGGSLVGSALLEHMNPEFRHQCPEQQQTAARRLWIGLFLAGSGASVCFPSFCPRLGRRFVGEVASEKKKN